MPLKFFFFFFLLAQVSQAQEIDVLHYRFSLDLHDQHDTLYGQAAIKVVNKSGGEILFDLLEKGADGKGMTVFRVEKGDSPEPYPFAQERDKIVLPILKGTAGDTLLFRIFYKGIPADGLIIAKNKFGDRTFFADNWPNRARHWIPCNDRPDDKASFEFVVKAPAHYSVVSNGLKVSEQTMTAGKKQTHWREDVPQATKVMVIGVARFAVKTFADSPDGIPVSAWVYPQDSAKGVFDYALAPGILKFFTGYIGPFPYRKLANVQSTTIFGGMENASAIFYDEHAVTGRRDAEDLLAHEIAHQWFGDAASEKSFAHLWLSEGFANYLTTLYVEKKYGRPAALQRRQKEREEVIAFSKEAARPVVDSSDNLMALLNANSYQKGAWVLHMLRHEVGDATFQTIIQAYYHQYRGGNAETRDFEALAEKISGKELTPFFDQWLYQPGIPIIAGKFYQDKNQVVLTVAQTQKQAFQFPLEIMLVGEDGKQLLVKETITSARQLFRYQPGFAVKKIILDPEGNLLFENRFAN